MAAPLPGVGKKSLVFLLPGEVASFSPRQTILRLTLQLLLVAVLLWRFCLDILAV